MAVSAIIKDGEVSNIGTSYEEQKANAKDNSSVDKEQFLQLLVAQMQYQDPLEPTDNTQYVSQLATFSELEQMQNMAKSTDMARAQALVGKNVTVNSTNSVTGITTEVTGKVESVISKSSGSYVVVNGELYEIDKVVQVLDDNYASATEYADTWNSMYASLPSLGSINASNAADYKETIEKLANAYDAMDSYQKGFISDDKISGLKDYIERMQSFGIVFGEDGSSSAATDTHEEDEAVEEVEETSGSTGTADTEETQTPETANTEETQTSDTANTEEGSENTGTTETGETAGTAEESDTTSAEEVLLTTQSDQDGQ
ncbi:MAG: hypothetical protein IJU93_08435 [Lachnospiraceae bacterium]|nr:hypothetical protein [Lachnospiraceae bacterium]